ncbi:MAG: ABC transporter permease subunit [Bacteroidaceae bacterium]|nr:ABC transporter permease subunit [Bacteroidaceae bacterium]
MKIKLSKLDFFIIAFLFGTIATFTNCGGGNSDEKTFSEPDDLNKEGYVIGVPRSAMAMTVGERFFDKAEILYYNTLADGYTAVQQKKIDAFVFDRHSLEYIVKANPRLSLLPDNIGEEHIVVGLPLKHKALQEEVNAFIAKYIADGTYQDMHQRWFSPTPPPMPQIPAPTNPTRKLKVATEGLNEPMNYYGKGGELTGFDIEFIKRLALHLNAELEISTMSFDGLLMAVESGKIDMLVANLNITDETKGKILYSDDYVESAISVIINTDNKAKSANNINSSRQLHGKTIGVISGTTADHLVQKSFSDSKVVYFNAFADMPIALQLGKIDAFIYCESQARLLKKEMPELHIIPEVLEAHDCAFLFSFNEKKLCEAFNEKIRKLKADGTLKKLEDKWIMGDKAKQIMPAPPSSSPKGTLRYATSGELEPFTFIRNGKVVGYDIEVAQIIAQELGYTLEPVVTTWSSYLDAVASGKVRFGVGCTAVTEERKKRMLFSEPNYTENLVAATLPLSPHPRIAANSITKLSDLDGKEIAVVMGTSADKLVKEKLPKATPKYFNSMADLPIAVLSGKVEAFATDKIQAEQVAKDNPTLRLLEENLSEQDYAFVFSFGKKKLCDAFSRQIRQMEADGTLQKIKDNWLNGKDSKRIMPPPITNAPNGTLKYAINPVLEPFAYVRNGEIVGYDVEVAQRIAEKLGYNLEQVVLAAYLEGIAAGKVDIGVGLVGITEERKQKVLFCEPCYTGVMSVIVNDKPQEDEGGIRQWFTDFSNELANSFERTFIKEERWKMILQGLIVTIQITLLSVILGTLIAFGVCSLRRSKNVFLSSLAHAYIALMQGMPILVILMILYYIVFAKVEINAVLVAVIGFAMNFGAYAGETFRSGINSIPKGQREAALALGFTPFAAFRKVIFPQVLWRIMPVYRGEFVSMFKMTSVVGYIAIQDLTKMSDIIRSRTYEAFFPLIATAIIYFVSAHLLASALTYIEYRLNPANRAKKNRKP